jgi:hypothetical protein
MSVDRIEEDQNTAGDEPVLRTPPEGSVLNSLGDLTGIAGENVRNLENITATAVELNDRLSALETGLRQARRLNEEQTELLDEVLAEPDLDGVAKQLARRIHGDVVICGPDGAVLSASGDRLPGIEKTVATGAVTAHTDRQPVWLADSRLAIPIMAGNEGVGTIVARPGHTEEMNQERLRMFAQAAAVAFLVRRKGGTADGPDRDDLLDEVLAELPIPPAQLDRRARRLGIDLREPYLVLIARPEAKSPGRMLIWASSFTRRAGGLRSTRDGAAVLVVPGTEASATARVVRNELTALLDTPVTVGAAGPVADPESILPGYRQASRCLDAITALGGTGSAASTDELGFVGLLLSDTPDVGAFVHRTIGPVLRYDDERRTHLIETLNAYFDAGSSPTYAAERLYVHPNTVARRLERVADLLGEDWQQPERVVDLQLALRIQRIRELMARPSVTPEEVVSRAGRG